MSRGDVIIALDFPSAEAVYAFLDKFENEARKPYVKVGMELFYAEGPQIVREIKARGHKIFLDLKPTLSKRLWPRCPGWMWT